MLGEPYQSGLPCAPFVSVPASQVKWTRARSEASLWVEKVVHAGVHRFGFYADIQNRTNQDSVTSENGRYTSVQVTDDQGQQRDVWLGGPLTRMAGRQITLGERCHCLPHSDNELSDRS
jgi:hypothetical protein